MKMNLSNIGHTFLAYDGVNLSDHFVVKSIDMPLLPTIDAASIAIDGKPGAWFSKRQIGTRDIIVGLGMLNDDRNRKDILQNWIMLSDILAKDTECKLELGDGRYVNAVLVGDTEMEFNGRWSVVNVTFRCFDPYVYGDEHTVSLKQGNNTFNVLGKYPTNPVIKITGASTVTVTDNDTGDKVRVESIASGKTLVIDMGEYRCTIDGLYKSADLTVTDFWPLRPGRNTLNLSSGSGTLTYREVYL